MKRYIVFFVISFFSLFFLFSGLFGERGYFYNNALKKQIEDTKEESERLTEVIEGLKEKRDFLNTEEGLRDSAINLGYYVKGDDVYWFENAEKQGDYMNDENRVKKDGFAGLSTITLVLITFAASFLITALIWFLSNSGKSNRTDDSADSENNFHIDDSDLYIKA